MKSIFCFALLLLPAFAFANTTDRYQRLANELDEMLQLQAAQDAFSGAILISRGDKVLLRKAYGFAHKGYEVANRPDTRFNLGSVDKQFTMVAVMALTHAGQIDLDATVDTYLPNYPNEDVANNVTIRHLLTHTSGMGYYWSEALYRNIGFIRSLDDFATLFADAELAFRPGKDWAYSNNGYIVLGLIIEAVTGDDYHDHIRRTILDPLGMTATGPFAVDAVTRNLATHYTRMRPRDAIKMQTEGPIESGPWFANYYTHPPKGGSAGGGYSTLDDLLTFSHALRDGLVPERLFKLATQPATPEFFPADATSYYGYGMQIWDLGTDNFSYGHSGGGPGNGAIWRYYPELDLTVVILTNQEGAVAHPLRYISTFLKE